MLRRCDWRISLVVLVFLSCSLPQTAARKHHHDNNPTPAPTPASSTNSSTSAPPSFAPSSMHNDTKTPAPTPSSNATSLPPSVAPTPVVTPVPTPPPPPNTPAPTTHQPTELPTAAPTVEPKQHHFSFFRILAKTIAWCIIMLLLFLGFGAIMSNRYRIYYFLRGVWYTLLRLDCTQWILQKLRLRGDGGAPFNSSLNTIIFDNELSEGLLLRETDT